MFTAAARAGVRSSWREISTPFSATTTRLTPFPPDTSPASATDSCPKSAWSRGDDSATCSDGRDATTTGADSGPCVGAGAAAGETAGVAGIGDDGAAAGGSVGAGMVLGAVGAAGIAGAGGGTVAAGSTGF